MFPQPPVHGFKKFVGVRLFRASIGKCNQVNGNPMLMKPNQKSGTVRAAPKRYNIQSFTSAKYHQFIKP